MEVKLNIGRDYVKKRLFMLLLAVCLTLGLSPGTLAAEEQTARVVLEAGTPDANGCFTMEMRIYNATFNAFQFVLWYDEATVLPVDGKGAATSNFTAFAQKEDDGWMSTVGTSLDPEQQEYLQKAIDEGLSFDDETSSDGVYALQGAATLIDNETGKVTAIVGGRSQETDVYGLNRAYQSFRQPGSSIKPLIVYAPALENGYGSTTIVKDVNVDAAKAAGENADMSRLPGGTMTLRQAVERSRNGVAWSVYADITPEVGMASLTKMRFDNIVAGDYYMAACLGGFTHGVTSEEMAGAYAALANGGMYRNPTCIVSMKDKNGEEIFQDPQEERVYQENASLVMVDILTGVVARGTASGMGWTGDIEAAGKTGTTNNSRDGWFCGMTPYYTLTVWVGYDQPRTLSSLWGSTYPAQIWKNAMSHFVEGLPAASFEEPGPENPTKEDAVAYVEPETSPVETVPPEISTEPPTEATREPVTGIHGGPGIWLD